MDSHRNPMFLNMLKRTSKWWHETRNIGSVCLYKYMHIIAESNVLYICKFCIYDIWATALNLKGWDSLFCKVDALRKPDGKRTMAMACAIILCCKIIQSCGFNVIHRGWSTNRDWNVLRLDECVRYSLIFPVLSKLKPKIIFILLRH